MREKFNALRCHAVSNNGCNWQQGRNYNIMVQRSYQTTVSEQSKTYARKHFYAHLIFDQISSVFKPATHIFVNFAAFVHIYNYI